MNGPVKVRAIVLKETVYREADKILVCLSPELGRITVSAKGVKSHKSSNIAACAFLAYSEMMLYPSRDMYTLSQSSVIHAFYEIRQDVIRLTYASYFSDLLMDCIQEQEEAENAMKLFLNTLHFLSEEESDPAHLATLFEFRLLKYIGYNFSAGPDCFKCGENRVSHVQISRGAFVCKTCAESGAFPVSSKAVEIIGKLVEAPLKEAFRMSVGIEVMPEIRKISEKFLTACLDKRYTKLDFLKTL